MSEEGISACYVNSHSFVHDIVTLSTVSHRQLAIEPLLCKQTGKGAPSSMVSGQAGMPT